MFTSTEKKNVGNLLHWRADLCRRLRSSLGQISNLKSASYTGIYTTSSINICMQVLNNYLFKYQFMQSPRSATHQNKVPIKKKEKKVVYIYLFFKFDTHKKDKVIN